MAFIAETFEGLLFGPKKEKQPQAPTPPPSDVEKEAATPVMDLEDYTHTPGRLRGAPTTELKKRLGVE